MLKKWPDPFWSLDKLTDSSKGAPAPEPVEGPLYKPHIYTVAYVSGSESSVLFPWLILLLALLSVSLLLSFPCFSVFVRGNASASAYSSFRVFPCSSVANAYAFLPNRRSRIRLWKQCFFSWLILLLALPSVSMLLSFPCFSVLIRG